MASEAWGKSKHVIVRAIGHFPNQNGESGRQPKTAVRTSESDSAQERVNLAWDAQLRAAGEGSPGTIPMRLEVSAKSTPKKPVARHPNLVTLGLWLGAAVRKTGSRAAVTRSVCKEDRG